MSEVELAMLRSRLKLYVFQRRLPQIRDIRPCPNCFAMFVLCQTNSIEEPVLFPPAPPKINVASTSAVQTTSVRQAPNNFDLKGCGEGRFWIANSMSRLMLIHRNVQLSR